MKLPQLIASMLFAGVLTLSADPSPARYSLKFSDVNNLTTDANYATILQQPIATIPTLFSGDAALFAVVRFPQDKRVTGQFYGLLGNSGASGGNKYRIGLSGTTSGVSSTRNKLRFNCEGANFYTPAIDEDAFLVVAYRSGSARGIDWYSLTTGQKHTGDSDNSASSIAQSTIGPNLFVGGYGSDTPVLGGGGAWPGEIECVGYVNGAVSDSTWSQLALGADPISALGAGSLLWFRQLDGTSGSLLPVAGATADQTAPSVVWGAPMMPGSTLRRQSGTEYLLIDGHSDGWVFGLVPGQSSRSITISGKGSGFAEDIEVRVLDAESNAVVVDWTNMGALANGQWSGTIPSVPQGGWYHLEARAGTFNATSRDDIGVGWKIMQLGQSQTSIYLSSNYGHGTLDPTYYYGASYLSNDTGDMSLSRIGGYFQTDGLRYFVNQFRQFDATTPIMIIDAAVNGTSQVDLVTDGQGRSWSVLQEKLDAYGNDVSVVVRNWGTSDMSKSNYDDVLNALVKGTGSYAGNHSLNAALQPGYRFAVSPLTRHVNTGAYESNASRARSKEVNWAFAEGHTVGPPVSDFTIDAAGGPHQTGTALLSNPVFGVRQAIAVARALGLDSSTNPGFSGLAVVKGNFIRLGVTLPNGGDLFSSSPNDLQSFEVNEGGGWTRNGFQARIDRNTILLTRDSGNWAPGTQVRYLSNLETRASGDGAAEAAIIGSALYETWPYDPLGLGLPLLGQNNGSTWATDFAATGQTGTTAFARPYDDWAFTDQAMTGPAADATANPDYDGDINLAEFAFAGDPWSPETTAHQRAQLEPIADAQYLSLTIPVRSGAVFAGSPQASATLDGITYQIEASPDLINFQEPVVEISPAQSNGLTPLSPGWDYRTFRLTQPITPNFSGFIRAKVNEQ